ncbi:hypothetical protein [Xenorhabdus stockiae]|uniref:hypothetical protein n=1 Tax=Xenorhabdus stockiae TaxID=351614 RepID=UPI0040630EC3
MKRLIKKWFKKIIGFNLPPSESLSKFCNPLLKESLILLDDHTVKRVDFLDSINDKECHFRNNRIKLRVGLIPLIVGFMLCLGFFVSDFIKTWKASERTFLWHLEDVKKDYGERFFLNPRIPEYAHSLKVISDDKKVSLVEYLYIRYSKDSFYGEMRGRKYLILDIGFGFFFLSANIMLFSILFGARKPANFVLDREKQLFYTWKEGKIYVSRYTELGVSCLNKSIHFELYGLNENNELNHYYFTPYLSMSSLDKVYIFSFMAKYLFQGKKSVSSSNFKRRELFPWLRKDLRPADWQQQISAILAELDRLGPPRKATDPK